MTPGKLDLKARVRVRSAVSSPGILPNPVTLFVPAQLNVLSRAAEDLLMKTIDALAEPSSSGCRRIVGAGGKRLRPELVLATAFGVSAEDAAFNVADPVDSVAVEAAVAIELLHSATLVHDDFLDESQTRRGEATINAVEGAGAAIIAGDALIAQSFRLIAGAGRECVEDLADALAEMCSGQTLEDRLKFCPTAEPFAVMRVSQLKTGALLKAACRIGGRLGGLDSGQVDALGIFGSDLGVALQLVDDTLDLLSDEAILGKPCGADFAVGTVTMPAVFALQPTVDAKRSEAGRILADLLRPGMTPDDCSLAREMLTSSDGPVRTITLARAFARRAARAVPDISAHYRTLATLPLRYVESQLRAKVSPRYQWMLQAEPDSEPVSDIDVFLEMLDATG